MTYIAVRSPRLATTALLLGAAVALQACNTAEQSDQRQYGQGGMSTTPAGTQVGSLPPSSIQGTPLGGGPVTAADLVNVGDRIFFELDSANLTAAAKATLERQAQWLQQHPAVVILIEGHTDERGTREYNLALGQERAAAMRDYLISLGVVPGRIQRIISYGKERPADPGSDEAAWSQNRRAVSVLAN